MNRTEGMDGWEWEEGIDGWGMGRKGWKVGNGRRVKSLGRDLDKRRSLSVDLWGKEGGDGLLR